MLAQKNPEMKIDAIEIDKDAAEQAHQRRSSLERTNKYCSGRCKRFSFEKEFDLIISNPPFMKTKYDQQPDSKNVAHHSENLTLKELLEIIKDNQ
jgi:tRNA1Val (adenine37-N6)-methyltransferase